jgi:hypothetical protein
MVSTYETSEPPHSQPEEDRHDRVAWTKGGSNREVAEILGTDPIRITGDLDTACIDSRIELLVTKRFPRSEVVPSVVPVGFHTDAIDSVAIAVGDGPHSPLAVAIGESVARRLAVPACVITAYSTQDEYDDAQRRLGTLTVGKTELDSTAIQTSDPRSITEHLSKDTLLVHGAPGGSFLERHFTGTGNRLTSRARGCVLVVKDAPRRCFQIATDATGHAIAPELLVMDALHVMVHPFAPVVRAHELLGIVRAHTLVHADAGSPIAPFVEPEDGLERCEAIDAIASKREHLGNGPIPVVDDQGNLTGVILD